MDTTKLKKFAQFARRTLMEQVGAKLESVRADGAAAQREHPEAFKKLEAAIAQLGEPQVIERVAYIWFNRFSALRFLDVNDLNLIRVVSPLPGQFQPEILVDAKAGNINDQLVPEATRRQVRDLLDGQTPSPDAQAEAYRLLLVAVCNSWQGAMPFLFERIDDYTELLLPADLLSNASVLAYLREAMTPDVCKDVEVIGWLYQFYISEKKDLVFAGLKQNKKITAENIPAATQLFTPHWIVRYLVENSLGRLWLLNRPESKLAEKMDYYIAPEEPETDFLKISKPEEISVCDPACGSGHMLTYAFDLLYAIYEEEGYEADKIPALILANNLTGVEIDDRAGALAAFALAMKAAARLGRRRFLRMEVKPDICVMQDVRFKEDEIPTYISKIGRDLFTDGLIETMKQFDQAKNFGSLIVPKLKSVEEVRKRISGADLQGNLFIRDVHERVQKVLEMAEALSSRYHVVVANPPYMGAKGMDTALSDFAKEKYPDSRFDLFAMFMERAITLSKHRGSVGMINMQGWMFASSLEALRSKLLSRSTISTMAHLGSRAFDTISGEVVSTTAFTLLCNHLPDFRGTFLRLVDGRSENEKQKAAREAIAIGTNKFIFSTVDIERIPGQPIAYWLSGAMVSAFKRGEPVSELIGLKAGLSTGDNTIFQRQWHEVALGSSCLPFVAENRAVDKSKKWYPCHSGGPYRKWYGNHEVVVNWENNGESVRNFGASEGRVRSAVRNESYYFREGLTWSKISSGRFDARYRPKGFLFDDTGRSGFGSTREVETACLGMFCSTVGNELLAVLCPSMSFTSTELGMLPFDPAIAKFANQGVSAMVKIAQSDWDASETSWDFTRLPLLSLDHRAGTLESTYARLRTYWRGMTDEMQRLEEENNRIFIDAYGLQGELTTEVPLKEITLTCNPAYSIGVGKTDEDREDALRARTMTEFLSYAVGCMFGRYSLDAPGLILANQGERLEDYLARIPVPSFEPDKDNVIPVLDGDWFADDITERFRRFLRITFGDERFRENLAFIEAQIGDIRKYFTKSFYEDHLKRYKRRPIYWMFSSPRGTFQALIYMHRYRPDTVSVLRNEYLVEFIRKLEAERAKLAKLEGDPSATQAQRTRALKDTALVAKQIAELEEWEREVIFPLAQAKIEIDLDEGVKRNYPRFGAALKPIKGLEAADE
jgi:type II restriction/modification system DNA methylase subunit YeeA